MSRLLVFSHARVITRRAVRPLARVYVCIRVRVHHGAPEIPFNLKRLSAHSRVITRNFVRLKLASTEPGAYIGNARLKGSRHHYQRAPPLPRSRVRETKEGREGGLRVTERWRIFSCQRGIHAGCALGSPFYRISFSRYGVLRGDRKQKSDIEFVDEKIKQRTREFERLKI